MFCDLEQADTDQVHIHGSGRNPLPPPPWIRSLQLWIDSCDRAEDTALLESANPCKRKKRNPIDQTRTSFQADELSLPPWPEAPLQPHGVHFIRQ